MSLIEFKRTEIKEATDVGPALEEVRANMMIVADRAGKVEPEVLQRAAEDIQTVKGELTEVRKELRAATEAVKLVSSTLPGSKLSDMAELRHFPRSKGVEVDPEFGVAMLTGQRAEARHAMYDFLTQPVEKMARVLPADAVAAVERARHLHDALAIVDCYMNAIGGSRAAEYQRAGGVRSLRMFSAYQDLVMPFERAIAEGAGAGGTAPTGTTGTAWVPTGYATTLIEDIRQELVLMSKFQTVNMPQNPYMFPVQGDPVKAYKVPEAAGDWSAGSYSASPAGAFGVIGSKNIQTLNMVFNAVKMAALMLTSTELEEDSIVSIVSMIRSELAFAMAATLEDAGINGQNTSNPDTFWSLGTPATNSDFRSSWDGTRYAAYLLRGDTQVNAGGGFTGETAATIKGLMGRFGIKPADGLWNLGYLMFAKLLMLKDAAGFALVATQDKAGSAATFGTGVLGSMLGSPIVVSEDYPQTQDASGLVTGAGALTSINYINTKAAKLGIRRGVLIEASRERLFEYDQILFRATGRYAFKWVWTPGSGTGNLKYKVVGSAVNIATT